jgi:predicted Rossmann fold flavoprotein
MHKQLVVIGGGAAGFFCAVNAARLSPGLKVTIIEKTTKVLSKVKVSGGGRCNLTHSLFDIGQMSERYPRGRHFVKKAFHRFFTTDTIQWFSSRGVDLKAEADGRMFPVSDSSQTVIDCLMHELNAFGISLKLQTEIVSIRKEGPLFILRSASGYEIKADFVCIAAGGYPKASLFQWLTDLGHNFSPPVPSLFTFNLPGHPITALMGISIEQVRVRIEGSKLSDEGPVLITHWGLSGPAVLRLSAWGARELAQMQYHFKVHIHWVPSHTETELKETFREARQNHPSRKLINYNTGHLPSRLWSFLLTGSGIGDDLRIADLPAKLENLLIKNLADYTVEVKGKTTYKEEFVTAGGITLAEIDPNTMMSKKVPNLFFAGEILDVDGITGGYNFQHAWTSGYIAAETIASMA